MALNLGFELKIASIFGGEIDKKKCCYFYDINSILILTIKLKSIKIGLALG